jgi:hypothetical protein
MNPTAYLSELSSSPFFIAGLILGALGAVYLVAALVALFRWRPLRFILRTLIAMLLLSLGTLSGTIALGVQGYRALTREDLAARIVVRPMAAQRFLATFRYPDGREATYMLEGDQVYVDARILKWHPYANMLGLHTAYELDRVGGRYQSVEEEKTRPRTLYRLAEEKPIDLFALRRRHPVLAPLLDAQYGSAAFVPVTEPAELELRVSASGLLIRPVERARPATTAAR